MDVKGGDMEDEGWFSDVCGSLGCELKRREFSGGRP